MPERGLRVDHTTIYRWVQPYAPEIDRRCRPFLRRTNDSYRVDETYVRVGGAWKYLYRGVDSNGDVVEQDHRFIKRRTRPMLGFKRFTTAWRTLRGIEIMHALRKGQARWMAKGNVVGQAQLIHHVFGLGGWCMNALGSLAPAYHAVEGAKAWPRRNPAE